MKSLICWSVTCRPAKELVLSKEKPIPYQPPLPPNEAPSGIDAAAGVTPVGLRPPFVTPAAAHSHPDCRGIPILIVAPHPTIAMPILIDCQLRRIRKKMKASTMPAISRSSTWLPVPPEFIYVAPASGVASRQGSCCCLGGLGIDLRE